jgi:hypothetical protein
MMARSCVDWHELPSDALELVLRCQALDARDVANATRVCTTWRAALPRHASSRFIPERLASDDFWVQRPALNALVAMGEHAAPHVGAIVALLKDKKKALRKQAGKALGALGEIAAPQIGEIVALLEHGSGTRCTSSCYSDYTMSTCGTCHANNDVKEAAGEALVAMGAYVVPHVGAIVALLGHADELVRDAAVSTLGELRVRVARLT